MIPATSPYEAFDEKGQKLTLPVTSVGASGEAQSDASGDVECIMTYNGIYDWLRVSGFGTRRYYKIGTLSYGTRFCTSGAGTGRNANGKMFGNSAAGNCKNQFQVRDW